MTIPHWDEIKRLSKKKISKQDLVYSAKLIANVTGFRQQLAYVGLSLRTAQTVYAHPSKIETLVQQLCQQWSDAKTSVEQALLWTNNLLLIHPFTDGNGRVSRVYAAALVYAYSKDIARTQRWIHRIFSDAEGRLQFLQAQQTFVDFADEDALRQLAMRAWLEAG